MHPCTGTESLYRPYGPEGELYPFMTTALEGVEGSASRPGRSLPPEKTRYPLSSRLGGPQGRSGQVREKSPPPGFDPRTVQPIANHYTNYATRPRSAQYHTLTFGAGIIFLILVNSVYKMSIIREPNKLEL